MLLTRIWGQMSLLQSTQCQNQQQSAPTLPVRMPLATVSRRRLTTVVQLATYQVAGSLLILGCRSCCPPRVYMMLRFISNSPECSSVETAVPMQAPSSVGGATELEVLSTVTQVVPDSVLMASSGTKEIPRKAATVSAGVLGAGGQSGDNTFCNGAWSHVVLMSRCKCRWHPIKPGWPAGIQGVRLQPSECC